MSHSAVFGLSSSILKGAEFSVAKGTLQYQMYVCPISNLVMKPLILFCVTRPDSSELIVQPVQRFPEIWNRIFPLFSSWQLGQIRLLMVVLHSAHQENIRIPPKSLIWWCFELYLYPQKLNQFRHVGGVSESSWWAESKTAIWSLIWPSFHEENKGNILLQSDLEL